ncbi:hypothetical protein RQX22_17365 [Sphingosinicella sp. GR2756]|uniref:Uncharacterized protein n=2 Tax=Sphingosinicella rhizophila TaxID=3050082 RepID=A0ABU3QBG8_9SPHN|nr:hypothetical protein [Sphingosinicella sp. GR2756]
MSIPFIAVCAVDGTFAPAGKRAPPIFVPDAADAPLQAGKSGSFRCRPAIRPLGPEHAHCRPSNGFGKMIGIDY